MTRLHTVAHCAAKDCPWEADGPDADTLAHRHTTTRGDAHTPTKTTHPTTQCAQEGCP
jgi:hypothetical protein